MTVKKQDLKKQDTLKANIRKACPRQDRSMLIASGMLRQNQLGSGAQAWHMQIVRCTETGLCRQTVGGRYMVG